MTASILPNLGWFVNQKSSQNGARQKMLNRAELPNMGNNLKKLREDAGWTQEKAASELQVSYGQYVKLERGDRRLTQEYINRAMKAYGVDSDAVLSARTMVPVMGYVGAGAAAHYYSDSQGHLDEVQMPPGGNENTTALEVRGDSLGTFFNQWIVYYDDVRNPVTVDLIGRLVVCETVDGRVLVKKLMRGTRRGHFHLLSQTESPIEDVELVWAARVKHMAPR